jgi:hypothetical protein
MLRSSRTASFDVGVPAVEGGQELGDVDRARCRGDAEHDTAAQQLRGAARGVARPVELVEDPAGTLD